MSAPSRLTTWSRRFLIAVAVAFVVLSIDWRPYYVASELAVIQSLHASGDLRAGAAKASLDPPFPTPIGGYNTRGGAPFEGVAEPTFARALVLEVAGKRVALVSVELVALPAPLREKVLAAITDLHIDDLSIGATHTHSGVGGYWDKSIAGWIGIGPYDPKVEHFLVGQIASAVRDATGRLKPARIAVGQIEASNYQQNRQEDVEPDKLMTAVRIDAANGSRIARVIVYAVHPTITPRDSMQLSGDWPGAMMASLEEDGATSLFFQGAVGDVTWGKRAGDMSLEERVVRFGRAIASDAKPALGAGGEGVAQVALDVGRVRVKLPPADASPIVWPPFERPASNLMQWLMRPGTTELSFLHVGPLNLAMVPGEPVSKLGVEWRKVLQGATIVGLMDDYLGYIETPDRMIAKIGEAQRSYLGPSLAPLMLQGLTAARSAAYQSPETP